MHLSLTTLALIFSFSSTLLAAPQKPSPLTPRAAPQNPTNLLLSSPSVLNGTSLRTYSVPFGLTCYNSDFDRAYINYDSCRLTFYHLSGEHSYREDRPYTSRNPRQVGEGKNCDIKVWKGPENVAVNDQYVTAMAAW